MSKVTLVLHHKCQVEGERLNEHLILHLELFEDFINLRRFLNYEGLLTSQILKSLVEIIQGDANTLKLIKSLPTTYLLCPTYFS